MRQLRVVFMGELTSTFSRLHYGVLRQQSEVVLWIAGKNSARRTRMDRAPFLSISDWSKRLRERMALEIRSFRLLRLFPSQILVKCPVRIITPEDSSLRSQLAVLQPDIIVSAGFSHILSEFYLQIPRRGAYNCHPSPLPRYAGSNPWFWMLRNGEPAGGVTIHRMVAEPDAGAIVRQCEFGLPPIADHQWLYNFSSVKSAQLLKACLTDWTAGMFQERPQDLGQRTFFHAPHDSDYRIDWRQKAEVILNLVRASFPAPGAWSRINGERIMVRLAERGEGISDAPGTVLNLDRGGLTVACGGGCVRISEIIIGSRRVTGSTIGKLLRLGTGMQFN